TPAGGAGIIPRFPRIHGKTRRAHAQRRLGARWNGLSTEEYRSGCMSFRCYLGLTGLVFAAAATAQSEPAATVTAAEDNAPGVVSELTGAHGAAAPGNAEAGAAKAVVCAACHGGDGNSAVLMYPNLAGQNERYIARQLALFKTGERN